MRRYFLLSAIVLVCVAAGCCGKPAKDPLDKDKVVARINNYELMASDFEADARLFLPNMRLSGDDEKADEKALDEIITRKILLQEAQRENFDKDSRFMKEIERYWEQALLKLLINKKIDEISGKIPPEFKGDTRQKMIQAELDNWVRGLRNSAKVGIYKENLKKIEIK
ncbi:MAG: hypothetical protein Q7S07_02230 [Candidatus Omnitrophota bacterium]|nr:hypothetical protein [Candidatus Omnitrophota bacterium]